MFETIRTQGSRKAVREEAETMVEELQLYETERACQEDGRELNEKVLTYCDFPSENWICIHTNDINE